MNITLKQLRVFCALYELRSFTAAARAAFVTQSAVSKLCAELESEVGQALFERSTRSVVPCDGAADFYAYAQEILGTVRAAERSMSGLRSLERGVVGVATSPMMMVGLVSDVVAGYHRAHPGVKLDLYELSTDDTIEYVRHGRADFGIVSTDTPGPDLTARVVYRDSMFAVCPTDHPLRRLNRVGWQDVSTYDHISLHHAYSWRRTVDRIRESLNLNFRCGIETGSLTSVLVMVRAGLGITIVPGYVCDFARQLGLHVMRIGDAQEPRHELSLIHRHAARPSIAAAAFIEQLETYLTQRETAENASR